MTLAEDVISHTIQRALDDLFGDLSVRPLSRERVQHTLERVATSAATVARDGALRGLRSADDIAAVHQISPRRIRALARARGIGWKVPGTRAWLFRPDDIPRLKPGPPGRPKTKPTS